jgi:tripartite-type tricarboxylate transporter receptor subunit TctC
LRFDAGRKHGLSGALGRAWRGCLSVALTLGLGLVTCAHAQNWPNRAIRVVIPFPAGNTTDIMTRLIGPLLSERLGQPVIIDNRPGASGMLGLEQVARAAPDGYTIAAAQGGNMVVLPHTSKAVPYNPLRDFSLIALSTTNYQALVASTNAPFRTFPEMLGWARANPDRLTVATNGEGGFPHLAFEHLRLAGGFTFTHVPYKGSAQIVTDLAGGQVMVGIDGISGLAPHVRTGRINLLAITNRSRVPLWPDAATVSEVLPGWESGGWFGYVGPAGLPREIVMRLNDEINRAIRLPAVADKLQAAGLLIVADTPEYFADVLKADHAKYGKLVRDIGFVPQ